MLLPFVRACLNFSPRGHSEHWAEITLCQYHLRSSSKKQQQRAGRIVVHVRLEIYHELSRTQPKLEGKCVRVGVDALAVVWCKNVYVYDGSKKKEICNRTHITPQGILLHYGSHKCKTPFVSEKYRKMISNFDGRSFSAF